jgi:hypothetical protein
MAQKPAKPKGVQKAAPKRPRPRKPKPAQQVRHRRADADCKQCATRKGIIAATAGWNVDLKFAARKGLKLTKSKNGIFSATAIKK